MHCRNSTFQSCFQCVLLSTDFYCSEKSGSCNSIRLAAIDKDNKSTLGSKNGYLIKAIGKLPLLR